MKLLVKLHTVCVNPEIFEQIEAVLFLKTDLNSSRINIFFFFFNFFSSVFPLTKSGNMSTYRKGAFRALKFSMRARTHFTV